MKWASKIKQLITRSSTGRWCQPSPWVSSWSTPCSTTSRINPIAKNRGAPEPGPRRIGSCLHQFIIRQSARMHPPGGSVCRLCRLRSRAQMLACLSQRALPLWQAPTHPASLPLETAAATPNRCKHYQEIHHLKPSEPPTASSHWPREPANCQQNKASPSSAWPAFTQKIKTLSEQTFGTIKIYQLLAGIIKGTFREPRYSIDQIRIRLLLLTRLELLNID